MNRLHGSTVAGFLLAAGFALCVPVNALWVVDPSVVVEKALEHNMLVVRFTDVRVSTVELRLNGAPLAVREVSGNPRSGEVTFSLDPNSLPSGTHKLEVFLRASDGKVLTSTATDLRIEEKPLAPIVIRAPKFGSQVSGDVLIEVQVGPIVKKPYVSLFIDRKFRELRNVPPYRFVWNTTREADGWHSIEAWAYDESLNTYKSVPVQVFVSNPGGRTDREVLPEVVQEPKLGGTGVETEVLGTQGDMRQTVSLTTKRSDVEPVATTPGEIERIGSRRVSLPDSITPFGTGAPSKAISLEHMRIVGQRLVEPSLPVEGKPTVEAAPPSEVTRSVEPNRREATESKAVREEGRLSANVENTPLVESGKRVVALAPKTSATTSLLTASPVAPAPLKAPVPSGTFSVLFDGAVIRSDVPARSVKGIPVAPFRHLFEHAGGTVSWDHAAKEMLAEKPGTRIRVRIGDLLATVNDQRVRMEMAAFLDTGRTLVPLSFVRQALNVEVEFEPSSNVVVITSKE